MRGATDFLDQLAAEGVKLDQLYVSPVCSPTRAQLQTGQYALRVGIQDVLTPITSPGHLPFDVPSLAEGMKEAGYATGLGECGAAAVLERSAPDTMRVWSDHSDAACCLQSASGTSGLRTTTRSRSTAGGTRRTTTTQDR